MLNQYVNRLFFDRLRHIDYGAISVTTPDGKRHDFSGRLPGYTAELVLHDWRVISLLLQKGDIGFAEAYRNGWWDSDDLITVFLCGLQNEAVLKPYIYGNVLSRITSRIAYLLTSNTLNGSKKNIHAHYDLGNEFYALWLDPSMTYSSALFSDDDHDLTRAQYRKYDRITERLGQSGRLLEIGCGWGGFAERALISKDFDIKGLTISEAQHDYARQRLGNNAVIALEDYRLQQGTYDQIVSIEMFEAVGEAFWPVYFSKIKSLLNKNGKAVIQTITIKDNYFEQYRKSGDAIRSFIFPGGMLPSPARFCEESAKAGLAVTDSFAFGKDYAHTMQHWLEGFEARIENVKSLGFDDRFIRLWRFYLTCCIASFTIGRTDVMQMELQHAA